MQPSEELAGKAFQLWCALNDAIEERDSWKDKYLKLAYHITQYSNDPGLVDDAKTILRESEIKSTPPWYCAKCQVEFVNGHHECK